MLCFSSEEPWAAWMFPLSVSLHCYEFQEEKDEEDDEAREGEKKSESEKAS